MTTFNDYQESAERTLFREDCLDDDETLLPMTALGLAGEVGELVDYLKKHLYHGYPLDRDKVKSESGDVLWYLSSLCSLAGLSLGEVAEANVKKLEERYPEGFVEGGGVREDSPSQDRYRLHKVTHHENADGPCLEIWAHSVESAVEKYVDMSIKVGIPRSIPLKCDIYVHDGAVWWAASVVRKASSLGGYPVGSIAVRRWGPERQQLTFNLTESNQRATATTEKESE